MYSEENNEKLFFTEGLPFQSWPQCKNWFNSYGLQEGFSYKIRQSKSEEGVLRRVAY